MHLKRILSKGKVYTFKFSGRKYPITGIFLSASDDYILVRHIVDYRLDGYAIFKITEKMAWNCNSYEKLATVILKKKGYDYKKEKVFPMIDVLQIMEMLKDKYQLVQLDTKKGDTCDIVKFVGKDGSSFVFRELTVDAKWRYRLVLPEKQMRFIFFDNDYLNSLKLVVRQR